MAGVIEENHPFEWRHGLEKNGNKIYEGNVYAYWTVTKYHGVETPVIKRTNNFKKPE